MRRSREVGSRSLTCLSVRELTRHLSIVNRAAMADTNHVYRLRPIIDIADDAVATDAIAPCTFVSAHGFTGAAGTGRYACFEEVDQAATDRPV